MRNLKLKDLVDGVKRGDKFILGKSITLVENETQEGWELLKYLYESRNKIFVLGITGPLGVGKSTFINRVIKSLSEEFGKTALFLCDPTSPISGGAFLGDRLRIKNAGENIFIRSMATRGFLGGISPTLPFILDLISSSPFRFIIVETAGVGQGEIGISNFSHLTIVMLSPGLGDEIQLLKGGLMEISDVIVITKGDYKEAESFFRGVKSGVSLYFKKKIPVHLVSSFDGKGISEVVKSVIDRKREIENGNEYEKLERRRRLETFKYLVRERIIKNFVEGFGKNRELEDIKGGRVNIYRRIEEILKNWM